MRFRPIVTAAILIMISTPFTAQAVPDVPTGVSLESDDNSVTVYWNANLDEIDGYYIYYGTSSGNLQNEATVENEASTSYTISSLTAGTTYYFAMTSFQGVLESNRTVVKSIATTSESQAPDAPTGFDITDLSHITETSVSFEWNKNTESDLSSYKLYYGQTSGSYSSYAEIVDIYATSYTLEGLDGSTRYYFKLTAVDDSGNESEDSGEIAADTLPDEIAPNIPDNLVVEVEGDDRAEVSFDPNNDKMTDFKGCMIYYWNVDTPEETRHVDVGENISHTFENLETGSTLVFAVTAYDNIGNESGYSEEKSIFLEEIQTLLSDEGFEGGCFLETAGGFSVSTYAGAGALLIILGAAIAGTGKFRKRGLILIPLILMVFLEGVSFSQNSAKENEPDYRNAIGFSLGYFYPQEDLHREMYDKNTFPVSIFYERKLFSIVSADVGIGYLRRSGRARTESGAETGIETNFTLIPLSASLNCTYEIQPLIAVYAGAGTDYWYYRETSPSETWDAEDDNDYGVGGWHGKIGVKLYTADESVYKRFGFLIETRYSVVDRFGRNEIDLGGLTVHLGAVYRF